MTFRLTAPDAQSGRCPCCGRESKRLRQHVGSLTCREEALRQLKLRTDMVPAGFELKMILDRAQIGVVFMPIRAAETKKFPHGPTWAVEAMKHLWGIGTDRIVYLLGKGRDNPELLAELAMHALSGK